MADDLYDDETVVSETPEGSITLLPETPPPRTRDFPIIIPELGFSEKRPYVYPGLAADEQGNPTPETLTKMQNFRDGLVKAHQDYLSRRDNELLADRITNVAEAVGGIGGSIVGGRFGAPNVGGAVGTAGARLAADAGINLANRMGAMPLERNNGQLTPDVVGQNVASAATAGGLDYLFGAAFERLAPGAKRLLLVGGRASQERAKRLLKTSVQLGGKLGLQDISTRWYIKNYKDIFGAFPSVGGPFRAAQKTKEGAVRELTDNLVDTVAPIGALAEKGFEIAKSTERMTSGMRRDFRRRYEGLLDFGTQNHIMIPTDRTREAVYEGLQDELESAPRLVPIRPGQPVPPPPGLPSGERGTGEQVYELLTNKFVNKRLTRQLASLAEGVPLAPREFQNLKRMLDEELGILANKTPGQTVDPNFRFLLGIRRALVEGDFPKAYGPDQGITDAFRNEYRATNTDFANMMNLLTSPAGKATYRFDPASHGQGILRPPGAGLTPQGQLISILRRQINQGTPAELESMHKLLGPDGFKVAVADYYDNLLKKSFSTNPNTGDLTFSAQNFRDTFGLEGSGLTGAALAERRRFREALNSKVGGAFDEKRLNQVADYLNAALAEGVPNPSKFLTRGMVFSGSRAGGIVSLFVRGLFGVAPGGLKGMLGLNMLGRYIADPNKQKVLLEALEPGMPQKVRWARNARLTRLVLNDAIDEARAIGSDWSGAENQALRQEIQQMERLYLAIDPDRQEATESRVQKLGGPARPLVGFGARP